MSTSGLNVGAAQLQQHTAQAQAYVDNNNAHMARITDTTNSLQPAFKGAGGSAAQRQLTECHATAQKLNAAYQNLLDAVHATGTKIDASDDYAQQAVAKVQPGSLSMNFT